MLCSLLEIGVGDVSIQNNNHTIGKRSEFMIHSINISNCTAGIAATNKGSSTPTNECQAFWRNFVPRAWSSVAISTNLSMMRESSSSRLHVNSNPGNSRTKSQLGSFLSRAIWGRIPSIERIHSKYTVTQLNPRWVFCSLTCWNVSTAGECARNARESLNSATRPSLNCFEASSRMFSYWTFSVAAIFVNVKILIVCNSKLRRGISKDRNPRFHAMRFPDKSRVSNGATQTFRERLKIQFL